MKNPARIEALLMVMTLSLLVYSVAQRRMRARLEETQETLPNQIRHASEKPTLRWIFQCLEGIHYVRIHQPQGISVDYEGISD
ncbi:MAG: transposase, partial [Bdellovibrionota bacterium]